VQITLIAPLCIVTIELTYAANCFWCSLFGEGNPRNADYQGTAWLFLGVANADSLLYDEEFQIYKQQYPDKVRLDYALSREGEKNKSGGKMYIQDKMEEYADEVFDQLDKGAHIYFCGLKGMMPGIQVHTNVYTLTSTHLHKHATHWYMRTCTHAHLISRTHE
jgi:ferredoxin-NADP reductase